MLRVPVVDIYVTGACNLQCPYCFGELDIKPGIEKSTFLNALEFSTFVEASVIELCGGEPLLYRDLEWAVENARAGGFDLILRTNGYLVPQRRVFIAENFQAVGISLDGDAEGNAELRPHRSKGADDPAINFEVPFNEIAALKTLNPKIFLVLASVATAENVESILALGQILLERKPPLDLWKIYQFLPNNFRAITNQHRFMLTPEAFTSLERDVEKLIGNRFPVRCRKSQDIDGSCLVINRDGEVMLGAQKFGNVLNCNFSAICNRLEASGAGEAIIANKSMTYKTLVSQ